MNKKSGAIMGAIMNNKAKLVEGALDSVKSKIKDAATSKVIEKGQAMTKAAVVMNKIAAMNADTLKKMLAGGAAGAVAGMTTMPIDIISDTQKQWRNTRNDPQLNEVGKSFIATAKELYHPKIRKGAEGGIKPFYSGSGGKMLKIVPNMALAFAVQDRLSKLMKVTQ